MTTLTRPARYHESFGALYNIVVDNPDSPVSRLLRPFLFSIGLDEPVNINVRALIHSLDADEMSHVLTVIETGSCQRLAYDLKDQLVSWQKEAE